MMIDDNKKNIVEKLSFFLENHIKVHITKENREFLNGYLTERKSDTIFVLEDDKKGTLFIFISDIFDVEEFKKNNSKFKESENGH